MLLAVLVGAWAWSSRPVPTTAEAGTYPVSVVGPHGWLWAGNVTATTDEATPLGLLVVARGAGGPEVVVERQALGGYVRAIAGFAETSTGGWNYCIGSGTPVAWRWEPAAADAYALHAGDQVQWRWAEGGSEVC